MLLGLVVSSVLATSAFAHGVVQGFTDQAVVGGFTVPVAFAALPDGRVLVAEKAGVVRVVREGRLLPDAFIDLRDRVNDYWDRGLLGIAVDPAFADNGYVYLFYVVEADPFAYTGAKTSRVVRVTADDDHADPASEVVLVGDIPADSPSHNGGAMRIGPDGALWITTGDASSFNAVDPRTLRAQQLDSLAGKLLRVGLDGRGLADNPFWTGSADDVRSKVWAYGFRNPFRLTFRPSTGRPYVADVGAHAWEEVNAVGRGRNHGWPCYEGPAPQAGYEALAECQALIAQGPQAVEFPAVAYPHTGGTASITGGAFMPASAFPAPYADQYFFGDFVRGTLHHVPLDGTEHAAGPIRGFATGVDGPVDVQADGSGLLYLSVTAGELRRIRAVPATGPRVTRYLSDAVELVTFAASGVGPIEVDRSAGAPAFGDGGTLTLSGETYAKGLGVTAPSDIRVALGGVCSTFSAAVGVDDETSGAGSVTFEVWLDGVRVVASGVMRGGDAPLSGTLDITGRQELRLVVTDGGDGPGLDHADWADARLECARAGGDTVPPVVVAAMPADGTEDAPPSATVAAELSEDLAPATVGAGTATLVALPARTPVAVSVSYLAPTRRVVLQPVAPLLPGVSYEARLAGGPGGIADVAGNPLAVSVAWTFRVAEPDTNTPPRPVILTPAPDLRFRAGEVVSFSGSATDPEDGQLAPSQLRWSVVVRHCPGGVCHSHPLTTVTGATGAVTTPDHGADSYLRLTLTATDSDGREASTFVDVLPRLVRVTLRSEPPGLQVIFGESRGLAPATFQAVAGSTVSVATLTPQHSLSFVQWASGAPRQHTLVVGDADITDTARFVPPPGVSYLSDLAWTSATNGAGPVERDRAHGDEPGGDGPPLTLHGTTYAKGLGVRAPSEITYRLGGACTSFAFTAGIDDDVQGGGSVGVMVIVDGRVAVAEGPFDGISAPRSRTVDLTGADELRLVVLDAGDGSVNDEVDWADARVTCAGVSGPPLAPVGLRGLADGTLAGLWWQPVAGASAYRLEAGSAPGLTDLAVLDLPANELVAPVPPGTYWVRVRAVSAWGVGPASSDVALVTPGAQPLPDAPVDLAAVVSGRAVNLRWAPGTSGAWPSSFVVELDAGGAFVPIATLTTTRLGAAAVPPGSYTVRVRGLSHAGAGPPSAPITVLVP